MITGQRKFLLGMAYELLSWAAFVWSPGITDTIRTGILQSQVLVLGLVIGGNVAEYINSKRSP